MILHITNDLMMSSTARSHAKSNSTDIQFASSIAKAKSLLDESSFQLCLVDLQMPGTSVKALDELLQNYEVKKIGYAQHVNIQIIEDAKTGCFDEVMTRGGFNANLGQIVSSVSQNSS